MKKLCSLVLAAIMLTACLTGCGGNNGGSTNPGGTCGGSSVPPISTDGAIGAEGSPVEIHVLVKDVFPDEEDVQLLCKAINEKMAANGQYVNVIFDEPPASSYPTALPLAVMNGEITADLIYFQGGDQAVSDQGLLEDLTPYIDGSTYVKDLMDESNVAKLKSYPYLLWLAPPRTYTPVLRTDWAEQMDSFQALTSDPTPDNYYSFFKELKDKAGVDCAITADGKIGRAHV